jgi:hypothetical protein
MQIRLEASILSAFVSSCTCGCCGLLQKHRDMLVTLSTNTDVTPELQGMCVDDLRRLHHGFEELDTDGMSVLAKACRDAGLEQLFLTCMKIYRDDSGDEEGKGGGGAGGGGAGGRGGGEDKGGASRKKNKNLRGAS